MRSIILLFILGTLCAACSKTASIAGEYMGNTSMRITGGPSTSHGSVRGSTTISGGGKQFVVEQRYCRITFNVVAGGLAKVASGESCTVDPEVDGGVRFDITEGEATFGDNTFGMTLTGTSPEGTQLNLTFAGLKR